MDKLLLDELVALTGWDVDKSSGREEPTTEFVQWRRGLRATGKEYAVPPSSVRRSMTASASVVVSRRLAASALMLNEIIEVRADKVGGIPVVNGTRFTVAQILAELADGRSVTKVAQDYDLDRELLVRILRALAIQLDRSFSR